LARLAQEGLRAVMSEKCKELCPHCVDGFGVDGVEHRYHRVHPKREAPYEGLPRCEAHGCILIDGEWAFECSECKARTDKLHGLFIPYLCKECYDALIEHQRATGNVCGLCGQPRAMCCC